MCLNSLTSTASADAGKNEALFAFWQVIGQSNDAAVAVSAAFRRIHIDEPNNG
jgi:hypothetical protein